MDKAPGSRYLLAAACLVVVVAGLKVGAPVLVPCALALFLAALSLPLLLWLRARKVPDWLAITLTLLVNAAVLGLLILLLTHSFNQLLDALPRYVERGEAMTRSLTARLQGWGLPVSPAITADLLDAERVLDFAGGTLRGVALTFTNVLLVLFVMVFILGEATVFPDKLRLISGKGDADFSRYARVTDDVQRYLILKTIISLGTGILVGVWVWMIGLDFALFWGLLAFLLNYVPNIGSIIAAIPPILLGLIQLGLGPALLVAAGYLAVNMAIGNVVEPMLMGRRFGLSVLVVMLSLVFWGWVWGPIGMFLSVPLTMMVKIALENTPDLRWLAVLLAARPPGPERVARPSPTRPVEEQ
ncbi:MAG: AI-2E family transporter [Longimicrobiaceae bacterium]